MENIFEILIVYRYIKINKMSLFCDFESVIISGRIIPGYLEQHHRNQCIYQCIFIWIISIRYVLAAITENPLVWAIIGDPLYVAGSRSLLNLVLFFLGIQASIMQTIFIWGMKLFIHFKITIFK